jgi:hypothetical protein
MFTVYSLNCGEEIFEVFLITGAIVVFCQNEILPLTK